MSQMFKGLPSYKKPMKVVVQPRRRPIRNEIINIKKSIRKINATEELKYKDVLQGFTAAPDTGILLLLNDVAQGGDTYETRDGNDIRATSVQFRGLVRSDPSHANLASIRCLVRILVFWDSQPNGAVPTLASTDALPGLLDNRDISSLYIAPYNQVSQKRYKILYDKSNILNAFSSDTTATPWDAYGDMYFQGKIPLSRTVKYDSTANGIADITTNSLYMAMISSNSADPPNVLVGARFFFKDV